MSQHRSIDTLIHASRTQLSCDAASGDFLASTHQSGREDAASQQRSGQARALLATLAICLAALACSGETEGVEGKDDTSTGGTETVGDVESETGGETDATADNAGGTDDIGLGTDDAGLDPDALDCPGSPGCACSTAGDCDDGFCIGTIAGKVCAQSCVTGCDDDTFKCVSTTGKGGDVANVCVPKWLSLCNPCNSNQDCLTLGNEDAACVPRGEGAAFCGVACTGNDSCPEGYGCETVTDTGGTETKQCVVKNNGACACSLLAIKAELATKCFVTAGDAKCAGKRTCLPDGAPNAPPGGGLSACLAPAPEKEKCDGIDNDCDGESDESTCDDGNPCTVDACGGGGGCKYTNGTGACDADDSVCTVSDECKDGKCVPGKAMDCNDQNPCTADKCDPKTGCQHDALTGAICNADDNECTVGDSCKQGACSAGAKKACDSDDACTLAKCSPSNGKCSYTFQAGAPCNDGNPCTTAETCQNDLCKGEVAKCDDGAPCTADSCETPTGCVHKPTGGPCTDSDLCTKQDACSGGKCVGLPMSITEDCNDNNACTKDACVAATGCQYTPQTGTPCEDGSSCTDKDSCQTGKCVAGTNICDCKADADCEKQEDGNLCNGTLFCNTVKAPFKCEVKASSVVKCDTSSDGACQSNACNAQDGKCKYTYAPKGVGCDKDGDVCTQNDTCDGSGACVAGAVVKCDDGNPCTDDSCDKAKGCVYAPNSSPCNADDSACTVGDLCKNSSCLPGETKKCDDNEPCTSDNCDKGYGNCVFADANKACDDGNACTKDDACGKNSAGKHTCISGLAAVCNDGNACTVDTCDTVTGCKVTNAVDGLSCDDGNACTALDNCAGGKCAGKPLDVGKDCDDGNACTADLCDSKIGCDHKPVSGKTCDDGDPCSVSDACNNGKCQAGTNVCACQVDKDCEAKDDGNACNGTLFCDKAQAPYTCKTNPLTVVKCDDSQNNFCATNTCQPLYGKCLLITKQDATPCDADGSVCTVGDVCNTGKCVPGKPLQCDDQNPCTADSCNDKTGCTHLGQQGACDADGDPCTANDACADSKCVAGKAINCDDNEPCTAELCDKKTGKCSYTELVQGCDDAKLCTVGDACGKNSSGNWTCLPGKAMSCDDGNLCTDDSCAEPKSGDKGGCKYAIQAGKKVPCYGGPKGTSGKGICKDGLQTCDDKGVIGLCVGDVKPDDNEGCDGKDNTCEGITDEGCAPVGFVARDGSGIVRAKGDKYAVDARVGQQVGGSAAPGSGGKYGVEFGFLRWILAWMNP